MKKIDYNRYFVIYFKTMLIFKNYKCLLVLLLGLFNSMQVLGQKIITGIVKDYNSKPLIGVVICQVNSEHCEMTDLNGAFKLTIDNRYLKTINFSYLGYNNLQIGSIDTIQSKLQIQMHESENLVHFDTSKIGIKRWVVTTSIQIDLKKFNFNKYAPALGNDNVELLNKSDAIARFEISVNYNRYQANLLFGFSESNQDKDSLNLELSSSLYGLGFGYNIIDSRRFILTPRFETRWYRFRLMNSEKNRQISLNQYIMDRDLDIRFNQIVGFIGASFAYKINNYSYRLPGNCSVGFYAGYIFKINDIPWIYSRRNRLIDNTDKIQINNLNFGINFSFLFD